MVCMKEFSFKAFRERTNLANSEDALEELEDHLDELAQADIIKASEYMALLDLLDRRRNRLFVEGLI